MHLICNKIDICVKIEILENGNHEKFIMIRRWQRKISSQNFNINDLKYVIDLFR